MKRIVSGVFLWAAALVLVLAGCDSGQIEVGSEEVQIQSSDPAPQVISMEKTANALTVSGPIKLYLGMSEQLSTPPSVVYEIIFGGSASASASKASEPAECTLLDGGNSIACPMTVAGCNAMVDYAVVVSGGTNAEGVEMEPFEMILNSGDMEAGSIAEIDNCWEYYDRNEKIGFDDVAELDIVSGMLQWRILDYLGDLAQANVYKELFGNPSVAVAMKVVGTPLLDLAGGAAFAGMQINPFRAGDELSDGYRSLAAGAVFTTWTDDFNFALYYPDFVEPDELSTYYTCMVKYDVYFKFFLSADGINYVELAADNAPLLERETCGLPAPIDAGWACPDDPMTELCDPDAPWGTPECDGATYADCLAYIEGIFTDELCSEGGFEEAFGSSWSLPTVRIMGYSEPGDLIPSVDHVRFRTTNITGDVTDCPVIY